MIWDLVASFFFLRYITQNHLSLTFFSLKLLNLILWNLVHNLFNRFRNYLSKEFLIWDLEASFYFLKVFTQNHLSLTFFSLKLLNLILWNLVYILFNRFENYLSKEILIWDLEASFFFLRYITQNHLSLTFFSKTT